VEDEAAASIPTNFQERQATMTEDELRREEAAIKIRACGRGFLARRRVRALRFDIHQ